MKPSHLEAAMASTPFPKKYEPSPKPTKLISTKTSKFDRIWPVYEKLLAIDQDKFDDIDEYSSLVFKKTKKITTIFTCEDIVAFLHSTIQYEQEKFYAPATGLITTSFIQNLYSSGQNIIGLDLRGIKPLKYLGEKIKSRVGLNDKSRSTCPLIIIIKGDAGVRSFCESSGTFFIEKVGNWCGYNGEGTYFIQDAQLEPGTSSTEARFVINQLTGCVGDNSSYSTFFIKNVESQQKIAGSLFLDTCTIYSPKGFHKQDHPADVYWKFKYMSEARFDRLWQRAEYAFTNMEDIVRRGYL